MVGASVLPETTPSDPERTRRRGDKLVLQQVLRLVAGIGIHFRKPRGSSGGRIGHILVRLFYVVVESTHF
jgi:hypothetical protein